MWKCIIIYSVCFVQTINSNMSRQHSHLIRGTSNDDRTKTKTKKQRNGVEYDRKLDTNPIKTSQNMELKHLQMLLGVAESMKAVGKRHPDLRFKESDLELIDLIIHQLTLMRRLDEFEREQNRMKAREVRTHLERVREKKVELINNPQRTNILLRSGSPHARKGLIACEMSPPTHQGSFGLIERKIQEDNREKTTFQALKKKQQCFTRIFEYIDRIADSLNVSKGEKVALTFKNYVSRIEASVKIIANREIELKTALKENSQLQDDIMKLKEENQIINNDNIALKEEINALNSQLETAVAAHSKQAAENARICTQLQQQFNLIAEEKLDVETALSKHSKKHKELVRMLRTRTNDLKELAEQTKIMQAQLSKLARQYRNNLNCVPIETFNQIIYAYTEELRVKFARGNCLKKQVMELQLEKISLLQAVELAKAESTRRNSELAIVRCIDEEYRGRMNRLASVYSTVGVRYVPDAKIDTNVQTNDEQGKNLQLDTMVFQVEIHSRNKQLYLHKKIHEFTHSTTKTTFCFATQTEDIESLSNHHEYTQTYHQQSSSASTQVETASKDTSTQSSPNNLDYHHQNIDISFLHTAQRSDTATSPSIPQLTCTSILNYTIFNNPPPTHDQAINTDSPSIYSSHEMREEQVIEPASSKKKPLREDSIFCLLLQAQQCTIVPEVFLLREEIDMYRGQIDRLNKLLASASQREREEPIFQFCL